MINYTSGRRSALSRVWFTSVHKSRFYFVEAHIFHGGFLAKRYSKDMIYTTATVLDCLDFENLDPGDYQMGQHSRCRSWFEGGSAMKSSLRKSMCTPMLSSNESIHGRDGRKLGAAEMSLVQVNSHCKKRTIGSDTSQMSSSSPLSL